MAGDGPEEAWAYVLFYVVGQDVVRAVDWRDRARGRPYRGGGCADVRWLPLKKHSIWGLDEGSTLSKFRWHPPGQPLIGVSAASVFYRLHHLLPMQGATKFWDAPACGLQCQTGREEWPVLLHESHEQHPTSVTAGNRSWQWELCIWQKGHTKARAEEPHTCEGFGSKGLGTHDSWVWILLPAPFWIPRRV